jgi:hypothetical protein
MTNLNVSLHPVTEVAGDFYFCQDWFIIGLSHFAHLIYNTVIFYWIQCAKRFE